MELMSSQQSVNTDKRFTSTRRLFQNSPEVDDEGYSIRPEEESEEGDILSSALFVICSNSFSSFFSATSL